MLTATEYDILARARDGLQAAARGRKALIVGAAAATLGCSVQTVYRKLEQAGFEPARKRRSDAGESLLAATELELVAGVLLASANQKGQRMPVDTALDMLRASGALLAPVSASTVSRQLHQRRMHPDQLGLASPSLQMASLHPNHVWQVDSTTGAYYYLPGGKLRWMPETEFYKNKVANLVKASSDLLTRYTVADHTSHAFKALHYLGGETAENLLHFVTWAMSKQDESPLHGVPLMLVMDPGAANKGRLMTNFCKRVGVELRHHAAGAARVTGSVEKAHDLVRMHFETRLRFVDPKDVSLDWLNTLVCRWAAAYCSSRVHTRHGETRFGKWMQITAAQLRVAASLEALREAAVHEPETRRVSNTKTITFGSREVVYDLSLVPGVVAGLRVTAALNVFRAPAIDVLYTDIDTGQETWHVVQPIKFDAHGYREGAPVWGQDMRTAAHSEVDAMRSALTREAYKTGDGLPTLDEAARARKAHAQAYAGVVDAMADVTATPVPSYLPRKNTLVELPARNVQAQLLNHVEACKLIRDQAGAAYTPQVFADVAQRWPAGMPESEIAAFVLALTAPQSERRSEGSLRLIGGGAA